MTMPNLQFQTLCLFLFFHSQIIYSLPFSYNSSHNTNICHPNQRLALIQFNKTFFIMESASSLNYWEENGPSCGYPKTLSWREDVDCCLWDGVTCDMLTGNVISLDLSCSWLYGNIYSNNSLFNLTYIKSLNLGYNNFAYSVISPMFGQYASLTYLNLSNSWFSGLIPHEISHLSKLVSLDLSSLNFISFDYPINELRIERHNFKSISQNLTKLKDLVLDGVNMSLIPFNLMLNLSSSLTSLSSGYCQLQGELPVEIFLFPYLEVLILYDNDLSGYLPKYNWSGPLRYLDLSGVNIEGQLPNTIGNLKSMESLYLYSCNLTGSIPTLLGNLEQLTYLDLGDNHLVGSISIPIFFTNLTKLTLLSLGSNNLNGRLPLSVFNLTHLGSLDLSNNQLVDPLPSKVDNVPNLISLELSFNFLNGTMPYWLSNLSSLKWLGLAHNEVKGRIDHIHLPKSLIGIRLQNNEIQGPIPKSLFQLVNLTSLDLSFNRLSGNVESNMLSMLKNLDFLSLSDNLLQGPVPILPPTMNFLCVSNNHLSGELPPTICNSSFLRVLDLSDNSLTGNIPNCLGSLSNILVLDLRMNVFYGQIPEVFTEGNNIRSLGLSDNKLEGSLPRSLVNCSKLEVLDVGNNKINDTFPHWLETLSELQVLSLRSNTFHGLISHPKISFPFPNLRIMDLSHNNFTGPLPAIYFEKLKAMKEARENKTEAVYMGYSYYYNSIVVTMKGANFKLEKILTIFTAIDLSCNQFQGEIPQVVGDLKSLIVLNLSRNNLIGVIPSSLGKLMALESLDLSSNRISGIIPRQLLSLTFLGTLNLSYNQLVGPIPEGNQFGTFLNDSYSGNMGLCGPPLSKKCNPDEAPEPSSSAFDGDNGSAGEIFDRRVIMMGYGCGLVIGLSMGYIVFRSGRPWWLVKRVERIQYKLAKRRSQRCGGRRH